MKFEIELNAEELIGSFISIGLTAVIILAICSGCVKSCKDGLSSSRPSGKSVSLRSHQNKESLENEVPRKD